MDVETSGRFRLAVTIKLAADLAKPAIDGLGRCIPFQRIMQHLLGFIDKDRQAEQLVAKLCARFPDAVWCLVDTSPATAGGRVARRQGHFYTEPPSSSSSSSSSSEWEFDAVAFPHHVLDGEAPASANARDALAFLLGGAAPATTTTEGAGAASVVMGPSVPLEGEAKLKATGFKPKYKV